MRHKKSRSLQKIEKVMLGSIILCMFLTAPLVLASNDLDDVEAGVEEAIAESEAAKAEALAAQKRLQKEKEMADARRVEADAAGAKARAKQRDAIAIISELDKKIEAEKLEAQNQARLKRKADQDYDNAVKEIAAKEKALERTQKEKEAISKERELAQARLVKKFDALKVLTDNLNQAKEERLAMEESLKKTRAEDKLAAQRLADTRAKTADEIGKIKANITAMNTEIKRTQRNTAARETQRQKVERSADQYEQDEAVVQATLERRKKEAAAQRKPASKK